MATNPNPNNALNDIDTGRDYPVTIVSEKQIEKEREKRGIVTPPPNPKVDVSSLNYSKSSGLGSVIYPKVQKNLFNRMGVAKDTIDGNATRAVWARMVSGIAPSENASGIGATGITRPVALMGGVSGPDGKLVGGFDAIYGRDNFNFGQTISDPNSPSEFGEKYRPMAGITGITTTTEGELGALRKASIKWQCWSLEQLEFYEIFFMKLASTCMIEFGWSTGKLDDYTLYDISTFEKAKKSIKDGAIDGRRKTLDSAGEYEVFSGLISNFNWQSNAAGGFECETEIMSHGEPIIGARTNDSPQASTNNNGKDYSGVSEQAEKELEIRALNNLQKYLDNFESEIDIFLTTENRQKEELVGKIDGYNRNIWPSGGTHVIDIRGWNNANPLDNEYFVTWGWMEDNILSKYMGRASKNYDMKYTIRSRDIIGYDSSNNPVYESVRVSCHPVVVESEAVVDARVATIPDNNPNYSAFIDNGQGGGFAKFEVPGSDSSQGYLRNILLNITTIKEAFDDVNTMTEGLEKLFSKVNEAFYGIFDFKISVDYDNPTNIKIIDRNYLRQDPFSLINNPSKAEDEEPSSIFIFPAMNAENNIVKDQSMESKIPSEGMYAALAGANKPSEVPDPSDASNATTANVQSDEKAGLRDFLLYSFNIPDAFSPNNTYGQSKALINQELDATSGPPITENAKTDKDEDWWKDNQIEDDIDENQAEMIVRPDGTVMTKEEYVKNVSWFTRKWESFKTKLVRIVTNDQIRDNEVMSSYEKAYYTKKIQIGDGSQEGTLTSATLTPLEVTLTIDGCGGIFPGNTIHTQYIPKKYKDRTALIIKSVSHEMSNGGWTTTLETMMTAAFNRDRYGEIMAMDKAVRASDDTPQQRQDRREDDSYVRKQLQGIRN